MIVNFKIALWWMISMIIIFNLTSTDNESNTNIVHHSIVVNHPGEKDEVNVTLTEVKNKEGFAIEYYMAVESVICLEEVCKIIPVTIFWDNIGVYKKYQLQKGATLEKYKADLFESIDYKKLHIILRDTDSPFKEVLINEILTVPINFNEEVDALSGETILELTENETVHGASLTCYTLWHWANGDVTSIIKEKTGESASKQQIENLIRNENNAYFHLAIDALEKRKLYTNQFIDAVNEKVLENHSLLKQAINYFEKATPAQYLYAIKTMFLKGRKEQKLASVQSLIKMNIDIPNSYLDKFGSELNKLTTYQEISLLLKLMQSKNSNSKIVIDNAFLILEREFLIARRAYWFLKSQKLNKTQQDYLNTFYKKHKDRL